MAETVHSKLVKLLGHAPSSKTEIIINDAVDTANGAASPFPFKRIEIYMTAPWEGDLLSNQSWLEQLLSHEYTHILQHDRAAGIPARLRRIFGTVDALPLVFGNHPQLWGPHWLAEGLSVHIESLGGQGRSNSAIYNAKMREAVLSGLHTLSQESYEGYNPIRWPFGHVYLYGAYFFEFINQEYGEQKLIEYLAEYDDNLIPWRMNHRAKTTFGVSSDALWEKYLNYLRNKFEPQIQHIQARTVDEAIVLDDNPWLNLYPTTGPDHSVYYYHSDLISMPEIRQAFPDGDHERLIRLRRVRFLDWHPDHGLLIGREQICDNRNIYTDLFLLSPTSRTPKRITNCARIQSAVWRNDGNEIIAVQHNGAATRLISIPPSGGPFGPLFTPETGARLGRIAASPDGATIAMQYYQPTHGWTIALFSMDERTFDRITRPGGTISHPRFSPDGSALFLISDHDNRVELRKLDLTSGELTTLTNSMGYIQDYAVDDSGNISVVEHSDKGLRLVRLQPATAATPLQIDGHPRHARTTAFPGYDAHLAKTASRPDTAYNPLKSLQPRGWLPIAAFSDSQASHIGLRLKGQDALGFHQWSTMPLWFDHEDTRQLGGSVLYSYDNRALLSATRNIVSDGENTQPVWTEEDRLQLLLQQYWNRRDFGWKLFAGIARETLRRHEGQSTDSATDQINGIGIAFNSLQHYGQSIAPTDGLTFGLTAEHYAAGHQHDGEAVLASLSAARHLGGNHHFYGELLAGAGSPGIKPFSLGGTENVLDEIGGITPLGQRRFFLRGYQQGAIDKGNHFTRATLEWRFPIALLYDGLLVPPLGLGQIHGAVFTDSGIVDASPGHDGWLTGVGVEFTADLLIGFDSFSLPITAGVAQGLDDELGDTVAYLRTGFGV